MYHFVDGSSWCTDRIFLSAHSKLLSHGVSQTLSSNINIVRPRTSFLNPSLMKNPTTVARYWVGGASRESEYGSLPNKVPPFVWEKRLWWKIYAIPFFHPFYFSSDKLTFSATAYSDIRDQFQLCQANRTINAKY